MHVHQDHVSERKVSWAHSCCKENVWRRDSTHHTKSEFGHSLKNAMHLYLSLLRRSLSSLKPRLSSISLKGQAKVYIKICRFYLHTYIHTYIHTPHCIYKLVRVQTNARTHTQNGTLLIMQKHGVKFFFYCFTMRFDSLNITYQLIHFYIYIIY